MAQDTFDFRKRCVGKAQLILEPGGRIQVRQMRVEAMLDVAVTHSILADLMRDAPQCRSQRKSRPACCVPETTSLYTSPQSRAAEGLAADLMQGLGL
nr:hypothetical protein [Ralstonia pseudosolanacearum]